MKKIAVCNNAVATSSSFRPLIALVFLAVGFFFSYARAYAQTQVSSEKGIYSYDFKVYFHYNKSDILPSYLANPASFKRLEQVIERHGTDDVLEIEVLGRTSPEGSDAYNKKLSEARATSMRNYLVEKWPALEGKITINPCTEDWEDFRARLAVDTVASPASKERVLKILDKDLSPSQLKLAIMRLPDYKRHYSSYFDDMRYSAFRLSFPYDIEQEEKRPEGIQISAPAALACAAPMLVGVEAPEELELRKPEYPRVQWPLFAISTNMLQDLAITPNFMIEVPIGKRWSIYAEYTFPWWLTKGNNRAWQILKWDLGARYYPFRKFNPSDPMDILQGHFFGLDLSAGYYDIEPKHTGYQGEFMLVGLEYGYTWKIARNWRIDAFIGAGWMGTKFRYYSGDENDEHLIYQHDGKLNWFGPTRLGVSIKYIIPYYRVKKEKKK